MALLLNEITSSKYRRIMQTIATFPHFLSWIIVAGIIKNLLRQDGMLNAVFMSTPFFNEPFGFLTTPGIFRGLLYTTNIWKEVGWSSIIYLAAITSVDPQLYEAAVLDGAGRLRQIVSITIPCIAPTIIIVFILALGSIMNVGFEKIILMYSPATYETADVISTYVYRRGIVSGEYSFASAVGLFNSAINCAMLLIFNRISGRLTQISLF
jgi:putative aldouronate transport system permease protein